MDLTAEDYADLIPAVRDVIASAAAVGTGASMIAYGQATDNWQLTITGIITALGGLLFLVPNLGTLIAKAHIVRDRLEERARQNV